MFIDTHAHLFYNNYESDLEEVLESAKQNAVDYILIPATDLKTSKEVIDLTQKYSFIYGSVGVHPHDTKDWNKAWKTELKSLAKNEKIVAIGEIGLDYFYDFSPKEKQIEAFKDQLDLAIELGLPVIIHNRDSDDDMMAIIKSYAGSGLRAQFHCYNSSLDNAHTLIALHHIISFTGNITFKKADDLREIAASLSLENILLETDSPFMTPIPYRGKRNEPSNIRYIAETLAKIHKCTIDDVAKITSFNAFKMFGIGSRPKTSFTYLLNKSLYINITNRCDSDCVFCRRKTNPTIDGYYLGMTKSEEPSAEIYIQEIGDPSIYDEIVFCGYGEPTIRWDAVKTIARFIKQNGGRTRLNTNGHGSYINKRDITSEMRNLIDTVSISINASEARKYSEIMGVEYRLYNEMINFAKNAKNYVEKVIMTVVSIDENEVEKARKVVEEKIGVEFRVRKYF